MVLFWALSKCATRKPLRLHCSDTPLYQVKITIPIFNIPILQFLGKSWQHCMLYVCLRESYHGNVRCWSYLKTASFLYLAVERCSLHFNEKSISLQAFPGLNEIPTLFIFTCIIMMFYVSCVHRGHLPEREWNVKPLYTEQGTILSRLSWQL